MTCDICDGKGTEIYKDRIAYVYIPDKPAAVGHLVIAPRKHYKTVQEIPDDIIQHLYFVASFASTAVYEMLGAEGTNIIAGSGVYDNSPEHYCIHVIARKENDGLNFMWEPKKIEKDKLSEIAKKIKDAPVVEAQSNEVAGAPKAELSGEKPKEKEVIEGENYLIKQLRRIP